MDQKNRKDCEGASLKTNRAEALFEHLLCSGPKNPHKVILGNLLIDRFFPGLTGIAGFKDFSDIPSLRSFFDAFLHKMQEDVELALKAEQTEARKLKIAALKIEEVNLLARKTALSSEQKKKNEVAYLNIQEASNLIITLKEKIKQSLSKKLLDATLQNQKEVVAMLIGSRTDINKKNEEGDTAIRIAVWQGYTEIAKLLIGAGANLEEQNETGDTLLLLAIWQGHGKMVAMLSKLVENINQKNNNGDSPLLLAISKDSKEMVECLIKAGADIELAEAGDTPLLHAIRKGNRYIVEILIKAGANLSARDKSGNSAVQIAEAIGHQHLLPMLTRKVSLQKVKKMNQEAIKRQAAVRAAEGRKRFALDLPKSFLRAADFGDEREMQQLLSKGVNVNEQDEKGNTALMLAVHRQYIGIITLLLSIPGIQINKQNCLGETVLLEAVSQPFFRTNFLVVKTLLEAGADISATLPTGDNILHLAAKRGHPDIVNLCLLHGAMIDQLNAEGKKPSQIPFLFGNYLAIAAMLNAEHLFEVADGNQKASLEAALSSIKGFVNARSIRRNCNTALHVAVEKENIVVVLRLLKENASVVMPNKDGKTALDFMLASKNSYIRALGGLLRIKLKRHDPKFILELPDCLSQIDSALENLRDSPWKKELDDLFFQLGALLAGRNLAAEETRKETGKEVSKEEEALRPLDAVNAYNYLNKVSDSNSALYMSAHKIMFMLLMDVNLNDSLYLQKSSEYPFGSFIAVAHLKDKEELQEAEINRLQACIEHISCLSKNDPLRCSLGDLIVARFFPQGLPGHIDFENLDDILSIRRFFDKLEEIMPKKKAESVNAEIEGFRKRKESVLRDIETMEQDLKRLEQDTSKKREELNAEIVRLKTELEKQELSAVLGLSQRPTSAASTQSKNSPNTKEKAYKTPLLLSSSARSSSQVVRISKSSNAKVNMSKKFA